MTKQTCLQCVSGHLVASLILNLALLPFLDVSAALALAAFAFAFAAALRSAFVGGWNDGDPGDELELESESESEELDSADGPGKEEWGSAGTCSAGTDTQCSSGLGNCAPGNESACDCAGASPTPR